jgi:hypothetical protein
MYEKESVPKNTSEHTQKRPEPRENRGRKWLRKSDAQRESGASQREARERRNQGGGVTSIVVDLAPKHFWRTDKTARTNFHGVEWSRRLLKLGKMPKRQ